MNLNKIGKYLLVVSVAIFILLTISLSFSEEFLDSLPEAFKIFALVISYVSFCVSFTLIFYNSATLLRKKAIKIITIISIIIFSFGVLSKILWAPGAAVEIMLSSFLFSFGALPLIIRSRYENRKTLLSRQANILSLADLVSIIMILMGLLFRVMHWPGGNYLLVFGLSVLVMTFIGWNISFRKEVKLRLITEEKLRETIKEVEEKHLVIEEKNKEITDSINYAKRIQEAILPSFDFIKTHLPNSFIYYQPKDIVAGDFYWAEKIDDTFYIAAADCTGHGVPGALVSVVCCNALNRSVKEFKLTEPGHILDKTRELVLETFAKSGEEIKDGMDISLLSIKNSIEGQEIKWAGANNPLWFIQNDQLIEVKANKQPIGKSDQTEPFVTHFLNLVKGDTMYLFTDGYADQFGGPKGKKFKYKQFEDLLLSTQELPLNEQFSSIDKSLNDWKGHLEQVDDVCVIGIRL